MKTIGNVLGSALNELNALNCDNFIVNEDLIGSALRDRMTLVEAVKIIGKMGADVKFALDFLQEQKFQQAFEVGRRPIYDDLKSYEAAISLLIERDRTDLLERCREIYESACKAEPLLKQVMSDYWNGSKRMGETEAKGSVWASHIKAYWEKVVSPILQTDAEDVASPTLQTKAEAPQHGRPNAKSISWLVDNPDGHLAALRGLAAGKRGVKFYSVIKAAVLEGWFEMPSHGVIIKEFGNIGASSGYYLYMGKNNETTLKQLRETLSSRCQNL